MTGDASEPTGNRSAQIFREQNVGISTQHLTRAIRLFIAEGEGTAGRSSTAQERHQGTALPSEVKKTSVTYQPSDQSSPLSLQTSYYFAIPADRDEGAGRTPDLCGLPWNINIPCKPSSRTQTVFRFSKPLYSRRVERIPLCPFTNIFAKSATRVSQSP